MSKLVFCSRCCMDGSDPDLVLDSQGVCNHCISAIKALFLVEREKKRLSEKIEQIKKDGEGKKYDCLIGLSGGVDSSTTLVEAVKLGLRPLCYCIDNGWQRDDAQENVMRLVEGINKNIRERRLIGNDMSGPDGVPLYRYTIDLKKFIDLQKAFIKSGVPNIEIPSDHIIMASSLEMASKYGIKWILSGGNVATESVMPAAWGHNARDLTHIKDIYKKMSGKRLRGLPLCGLLKWNWYRWVKKIKTFYLLDYLDYNRQKSIERLEKEFGWKPYGEKHQESLFTWWFQSYYLFNKFGYDKRKAHYSSLINAGQMTRKEAMDLLADRPVFPDIGMGQWAMKYDKHKHEDYRMDKWHGRIAKFVKLWKS